MSPRIGEIEGIEISIKCSEHGNPHIHGCYQGQKIEISIETLNIESGKLPPKQTKKLMKWIEENQEYLLEKWDQIVNSE